MEKEKTPTHTVLVSHTTPLFDLIKELGFEEEKSEGYGLKEIRKFKKGNKYVYSSHYEVWLFRLGVNDKNKVTVHRSLTIHDEELKFFAKRNPVKIKDGK